MIYSAQNAFCGVAINHGIIGSYSVPEEFQAAAARYNHVILGINTQLESGIQKFYGSPSLMMSLLSCSTKQNKIIAVAEIGLRLQLMANKAVKFVKIDVGEDLASEIANRDALLANIVAGNHILT